MGTIVVEVVSKQVNKPQDRPLLQQPYPTEAGHKYELAPQMEETEIPVGAKHPFLWHVYPEGQHPPDFGVISLDYGSELSYLPPSTIPQVV